MTGIKAGLPKQNINVVPAGTGVGVMKANYARQPAHPARCLLPGAADCLRQHRQPAAGARHGAPRADRDPAGAGRDRKRLIRQSLTESIVLSVLGGVAGLAVAYLGVKAIVALAFHGAKYVPIDAAPSLPVLAFAFALSLVTGVLFGTAPAWLASHADPAEALRGANRSTRDRSSLSQKILVIVQATLSVVLLAGAGLLTAACRTCSTRTSATRPITA